MSLQNTYNNVGEYPSESFGSVVDDPSLTETAGLDVYNFLDFGNELNAFKDIQQEHSKAFPLNRTNDMNIDTSNVLPCLTPLYYQGEAQNSNLFKIHWTEI